MNSLMNERSVEDVYLEANQALHRLWTRAVGTDGYDKAEWRTLDHALHVLRRLATCFNPR